MNVSDRQRLVEVASPIRYRGFDEESDELKAKGVSREGENEDSKEREQENIKNLTAEGSVGNRADTYRNSRVEHPGNFDERGTPSGRNDGYVELLRGSVPCPTCRGAGSIPKEQENELVALIPVRDKRLKPRRTWLYVLLAVVFCVVVAGLLMFFMFPRDVTMTSNIKLLLPSNLVINKSSEFVSFSITNVFNISNSNFFPVYLTSTSMQIVFNGKLLNSTTLNQSLSVPIRDSATFEVPIGITFNKYNGFSQMVEVCSLPYRFLNQRYMDFSTNTNYKFLGRSEEATIHTFPLVSCGNNTENASL